MPAGRPASPMRSLLLALLSVLWPVLMQIAPSKILLPSLPALAIDTLGFILRL